MEYQCTQSINEVLAFLIVVPLALAGILCFTFVCIFQNYLNANNQTEETDEESEN